MLVYEKLCARGGGAMDGIYYMKEPNSSGQVITVYNKELLLNSSGIQYPPSLGLTRKSSSTNL